MFTKYSLISTTLLALTLSQFSHGADNSTLIPRQTFFGNPSRIGLKLSPDGRWLGYIAPSNGVLNVWVAPRGKIEDSQVITKDLKRGIREFEWSEDGKHILYVQDNDGDENWRVYAADVASRNVQALSPAGKVQGGILAKSKTIPGEILVIANKRDPQYHDVYKANLRTGKVDLVLKNAGYRAFIVDQKLQVRVGSKEAGGGVSEYYRLNAKGKPEAKPFLTVDSDSSLSTSVVGFDQSGQKLMVLDGTSQDKASLVSIDFKTGQRETLATGTSADISELMSDPKTQKPQAVAENYLKNEWRAIDPVIQADIDFLNKESKGSWEVTSRTDDDQFWTVRVDRTTESPSFYLYDRKAHTLGRLFSVRPELEGKELAPMYGVEIKARDGLTLPALVSLPAKADPDHDGKPNQALPLVLYVHGGPWARDSHGYDSVHQWLANRGLAVLSVNYRGSSGFGKNFLNKANKEFAGAMHDDLIDSINWAVQQGIAQKDKIAIMGGSYGGYATLVGMTFTPDNFACGVDIVGPSNLQTLIESFPAYWQPFLESTWYKRVGDPRTAEGKKTLWERSPLSKVDQIKKPLLIGQGANDPRVTQKESDQIVTAMKAKSIPVTYVLYPDEGHGFQRPENRISFNAVVEGFLGKCLGIPTEPFGNDLEGSTIQVLEGAEHVPGLKEAYKSPKAK